jgi:glycosyltransferase involved in cell wall biosynthesis
MPGVPAAALRSRVDSEMPRVAHVIVTDRFAGAERYVCSVANETAARGWVTTVIGGSSDQMRATLERDVRWLPGRHPAQSLLSLLRAGRQDICHAHMTYAEAVALTARVVHRAPVVSTRHFAARRGTTRAGKLLAPWIASGLTRQIAISEFVAESVERAPDAIVENGVPPSPLLWDVDNRVVLVMHRLEKEKDTLTALRAWQASNLSNEGWTLRIVGDGSERRGLDDWVRANAVPDVTFAGWKQAVSDEFARAGLFLAPAPAEPLGLGVLEAMAAGVPVVAAGSGGHLETVGLLPDARLFQPLDPFSAAEAMRSFVSDDARRAASELGRAIVESKYTIARHVDRLLDEYALARLRNGRRGVGA